MLMKPIVKTLCLLSLYAVIVNSMLLNNPKSFIKLKEIKKIFVLDDNKTMEDVKNTKDDIETLYISKEKYLNHKEYATMLWFLNKYKSINNIVFSNTKVFIPEYLVSTKFFENRSLSILIKTRKTDDMSALYDNICFLIIKDMGSIIEKITIYLDNNKFKPEHDFDKCFVFNNKHKTEISIIPSYAAKRRRRRLS